MIDRDGFRPNVGIILSNDRGRLLWARRRNRNAWQFPQGGIKADESPEEAMYRELYEEVGLTADQVEILGCTDRWLRYRLPERYLRHDNKPLCIGQKQIWFMLKIVTGDDDVRLDCSATPEFDDWRWVTYWYPMHKVISFKQDVYATALRELAPLVFPDGRSRRRRARNSRRQGDRNAAC